MMKVNLSLRLELKKILIMTFPPNWVLSIELKLDNFVKTQ